MTFDNANNRFSEFYLSARQCAEMLQAGKWMMRMDFGGQVDEVGVKYFQRDEDGKLVAVCEDGEFRVVNDVDVVAVHLPRLDR